MAVGRRIPPPIIHIPPSKIKITTPQLSYSLPIPPGTIVGLSRSLNIKKPKTFVQYRDILALTNSDVSPSLPLHYIADNWPELIYGIYLFNTLTPAQQKEEMDISNKLPYKEKQMFWSRRTHLMNHPLPTLLSHVKDDFIAKQIDTEHHQHFAAARVLARGTDLTINNRRTSTTVTITKHTTRTTINNKSSKTIPTKKNMVTKRGLTYSTELLNGSECPICGYQLQQSIKKKAQSHSHVNYDSSDMQCIQCIEGLNQEKIANQKNSDLVSVYHKQLTSPQPCIESKHYMNVNLRQFLTQQLPTGDVLTLDLLKLFNYKHTLKSSVIQLKEYTPPNHFNSMKTKISGATWRDDQSNPHPNILKHYSTTADTTIVILPGRSKQQQLVKDQDYIILNNAYHDQSSINELSRHENVRIVQQVKAKRSGSACGTATLSDTSLSYTPITQKPTSLKLSGKNNCAMRIVYNNDNNKPTLCNFGYKPVQMTRLNTSQKKKHAATYSFYRKILVQEALAYIKSIACAVAAELGIHEVGGCYLPELHSIMASRKSGATIEDCLVQWMTTTGEMRNHQALACHEDGNKSHPKEIYSVFHRAGVTKKNGLLYLPLDNVCIEMICDETVAVCSFKRTPHVPDETRNTHNFSKVHGPKA